MLTPTSARAGSPLSLSHTCYRSSLRREGTPAWALRATEGGEGLSREEKDLADGLTRAQAGAAPHSVPSRTKGRAGGRSASLQRAVTKDSERLGAALLRGNQTHGSGQRLRPAAADGVLPEAQPRQLRRTLLFARRRASPLGLLAFPRQSLPPAAASRPMPRQRHAPDTGSLVRLLLRCADAAARIAPSFRWHLRSVG